MNFIDPVESPLRDSAFAKRQHADGGNILVYMTGSLGDALATVPALWALRGNFSRAKITILSDLQRHESRVLPEAILGGGGLVDSFKLFPSSLRPRSSFQKVIDGYFLWRAIRGAAPDLVVYFVRCFRESKRLKRDAMFFRLCGVRNIVGLKAVPSLPRRTSDGSLPRAASLAEQYLGRLASDGIPVPSRGAGRADIGLNKYDHSGAGEWAESQGDYGNRIWVAFGPGSNMNSKRWPIERFAAVGSALISACDIWPIVFGGKEDQQIGKHLVSRWKRGWVAAGELSIRQSAALLERCDLYVGNDTGTMHLAAAAGAPCVAIFSARDYPGLWEPYGSSHIIFRHDPPCCRCMLEECAVPGHPCLGAITGDEVTEACLRIIQAKKRSIGRLEPGC